MAQQLKSYISEYGAWLRSGLLAAAILIATGKILGDVQSNTRAIQANTLAITKNCERISRLELSSVRSSTDLTHIEIMLKEVRDDVKRFLVRREAQISD